jgi:hypothetical protein
MKTLLNKQYRSVLFFSIALSAISLSTTSCSNDDNTSNVIEKAENIPTEVVNKKMVNKDTVSKEATSHLAMNEIKKAQPSDDILEHGEEAHKNHCYKCHTDQVYTREDRFVKSIDALSKQVLRCKEGNDVPWFDEDSDAVVQFLNQKYYRF